MATAYINKLNDFSRKFFVRGGYRPTAEDEMLFKSRFDDIRSSIFESLLLFDKTSFKVVGENVPLAILVNELGVRGVESLIDEDALHFLHWQAMIGSMVDNIPGVLPLVAGGYKDGAYVDPEESIGLGLKFLKKQPNKNERKTLIRKVRDIYGVAAPVDPSETTRIVVSAFKSGKLRPYGLDDKNLDIYSLPAAQKRDLVVCAEDLLEYKHVLASGITNFESSRFSSFFNNSAEKMAKLKPQEAVSVVAKLEGFPDLRAVFFNIESPFHKAVGLRGNRKIVKFRQWIDSAPKENHAEIIRAYLDAIASPKGFFETNRGKLTKIMAATIIGAGVSAAAAPIGAAVAAAAGVTAGALVDPALTVALDSVDEFLLDGLIKGWTPRMFFSEIEKMGVKIEPTLD